MEYLISAALASGGGGSGVGRTGFGIAGAAATRAGSWRMWLSGWASGCVPHPGASAASNATAAQWGTAGSGASSNVIVSGCFSGERQHATL